MFQRILLPTSSTVLYLCQVNRAERSYKEYSICFKAIYIIITTCNKKNSANYSQADMTKSNNHDKHRKTPKYHCVNYVHQFCLQNWIAGKMLCELPAPILSTILNTSSTAGTFVMRSVISFFTSSTYSTQSNDCNIVSKCYESQHTIVSIQYQLYYGHYFYCNHTLHVWDISILYDVWS